MWLSTVQVSAVPWRCFIMTLELVLRRTWGHMLVEESTLVPECEETTDTPPECSISFKNICPYPNCSKLQKKMKTI